MKKKVISLFVVAGLAGLVLTGCTEETKRTMKDISSNFGGLNRQITMYSENGEPIKTWGGKVDVSASTDGDKIKFDINGKRVMIYNASVVIEEK